jgi:hypothetical protein
MTMLEAYFDELLARMQTPEQREAAQRAFNATPEELGKAAVKYATTYCNECKYGSHCLGADPKCACGCQ